MSSDNQNNEIATLVEPDGTSPAEQREKQTEKIVSTVTTQEKICVGVSISAIILAILNSIGLITGLPEFLATALKVEPFVTFCLMGVFVTVLTGVLVGFVPNKFQAFAWLPAAAFGALLLNEGWQKLIENHEPTVTGSNVVFICIATMMLGFCLAYHATLSGKRPTLSERTLIFMGFTFVANIAALAITICAATLVGKVNEGHRDRIALQESRERIMSLIEESYSISGVGTHQNAPGLTIKLKG